MVKRRHTHDRRGHGNPDNVNVIRDPKKRHQCPGTGTVGQRTEGELRVCGGGARQERFAFYVGNRLRKKSPLV